MEKKGMFSWLNLLLGICGIVIPCFSGYLAGQIAVKVEVEKLIYRVSQLEAGKGQEKADIEKALGMVTIEIKENRRITNQISRNVDRLLIKSGMPLPPTE